MILPDLVAQEIYARLAWGVVAAVVVLRLSDALSARLRRTSGSVARRAVAALIIASMWLPREFSPAFWIGMAFQAPSITLALLCVAGIWRREVRGPQAVAPVLWAACPAVTVAFAGLLLYAGVLAWLPYDLYALGFRPLAGVFAVAVVVLAWRVLGTANGIASLCVAFAVLVHAVLRIPTGNVWDAILDPLLVAASLVVVARQLLRFHSAARRVRPPA